MMMATNTSTLTIQQNVSLAAFTTFHIGGPAAYLANVTTEADVLDAFAFATKHHLPTCILGGGSNMLFPDEGYAGLVIKNALRHVTVRGTDLIAGSGVISRVAVLKAVRVGLKGMEHIAGIPGTIGGAVRGNAGAFGMETKDCLREVRLVRPRGTDIVAETVPASALNFAYRYSTFKDHPEWFVVEARFSLSRGDPETLKKVVEDDMQMRHTLQPYDAPSMGSIFKNPDPDHSAGKLIEDAGMKGCRVGGAEVSSKHANFIFNRGGARAADVRELIAQIKAEVHRVHGITLHEEIMVIHPQTYRRV